jgi:CheY-like chemotaxis protein
MSIKKNIEVLVIADVVADQVLISEYLTEYETSFILVNQEDDALKALKIYQFRLILLNTELEEGSGYALASNLRFKHKLVAPIVGITKGAIIETREKCFIAGMNACISYPIDKIAFVGVLTQFLDLGYPEIVIKEIDQLFTTIDLSYLKELSMGDRHYEREMAEKFITHVNIDLELLHQYLHEENCLLFNQTVHHLRSTLHIMGLGNEVETLLQYLSKMDLNWYQARLKLSELDRICEAAKIEVIKFLWNLKVAGF